MPEQFPRKMTNEKKCAQAELLKRPASVHTHAGNVRLLQPPGRNGDFDPLDDPLIETVGVQYTEKRTAVNN